MSKSIQTVLELAAAVSLAGALSFAQSSGEAVYKAHCQSCHGPAGIPNPGIAKILGVMPANSPAMKKLTEAEMMAVVKNGKGKMHPIHGLSDAQVKAVVLYFRSLGKK